MEVTFTLAEFNEWYEGLGEGWGPEDTLPEDEQTPFGPFEIVQDQRDVYQPDAWSFVIKIGDRYFERVGYYSSWDGVDWKSYSDGWNEVKRKEKVQVYYG